MSIELYVYDLFVIVTLGTWSDCTKIVKCGPKKINPPIVYQTTQAENKVFKVNLIFIHL